MFIFVSANIKSICQHKYDRICQHKYEKTEQGNLLIATWLCCRPILSIVFFLWNRSLNKIKCFYWDISQHWYLQFLHSSLNTFALSSIAPTVVLKQSAGQSNTTIQFFISVASYHTSHSCNVWQEILWIKFQCNQWTTSAMNFKCVLLCTCWYLRACMLSKEI